LNKGFTLIEVIIASLVIILFSSFLFYMVHTSILGVNNSNQYLNGVIISSNMMEVVLQEPYDTLMDHDGRVFNNGKGIVSVFDESPDIDRVIIEYKWRENRKPIVLTTLMSRY